MFLGILLVFAVLEACSCDDTKLVTDLVYFGGTIAFTESILQPNLASKVKILHHADNKIHTRNAFTDPNRLWPNGRIPFILDENIPAFTIVELMAAMQEIETSTYSGGKMCVMFVPRTTEDDYIHISWTSATHGSTSIGRAGGRQDMTVNSAGGRGHDDNLFEFMLILGLIPEIMRSDRNTYVNINITNAISTDPFRILTGQGTSTFGQGFDYNSLLLGNPYQYARDPSVPVTSAINDGQVMGQSVSLSTGDATLLQHAYNCAIDSSNVVNLLGTLQLQCHFHTDICNLVQDTTDNFDWIVQAGPTATSGTGPNADYSSGSGKFALAVAQNHHGQVARLMTQSIKAGEYCLRANLHQFGSDQGKLRISAIPDGTTSGVDVLNHSGSLGPVWYHVYLTVTSKAPFKIQFEATIGAGDQSDIALDDVYLYNGKCIEWD